jgi:hypothetical protein
VATEWFYFNHHEHVYEEISLISELCATVLCNAIIILQFFPFHFKTQHVQNIAREALLFQRNLQAPDVRTSITLNKVTNGSIYGSMTTSKEESENDTNTTT